MAHVPPYRAEPGSLPSRFLNWLEELRMFLRPFPHYTTSAGDPEGVIIGVKGDRYYDTADDLIYYKATDGGNTGWRVLSQPAISGLGVWRYRTETTSTPAAGRLQFDSTTIASVTNLYINVTNDEGTDMSAILGTIVSGDLVSVQVRNNAEQFIIIQSGTPALSAGVYTFPVSAVVGQGTGSGVNNNTQVIVNTS